MRYLNSILIFVGLFITTALIAEEIKADYGDNLTVVEMISSKIIPGSTVVPFEVKIDPEENSMIKFMKVELEMRWNSGVIQTYEMADEGQNGDKIAADGIFTTLISVDSSLGENKAIVNIGWENSSISYPVEFIVTTQQFPALFLISDIDFVGYENLENLVGFIRTEINGTPFEVLKENININLVDNNGTLVEAVITAKNKIYQGQDYEFFITSSRHLNEGFNINANLEMEFFGKLYKSPVQQVTVYKETSNIRNLMIILGVVLAFIIISILAVVIRIWKNQSEPYGFLLNSDRDFVVDFSTIKRNLIMKIIYKNKLQSSELKKYDLEGFNLQFFEDHIVMSLADKAQSTIRLNGKPISGSAIIQSESSVGFRGKLFFINNSEDQLGFSVRTLTAKEAI